MTYAVSDIHGRWEKYRALLERLSREDPDYTLYLLGNTWSPYGFRIIPVKDA